MASRRARGAVLLLVLVLVLAATCFAPAPARAAESDAPIPIMDNSFLIEEAYNQEPGVIQHINTFVRGSDGDGWAYSLTEEWPVGGQAHQFGFTLPVERFDGEMVARTGVGDLLLNYRWQAVGSGDAPVAFAPRVSLALPTGEEEDGMGSGGVGLQLNLPVSRVLAPSLVAHSNLGATYTSSARNPSGAEAATTDWNAGQSLVWLAHPRFNLMLEASWTSGEEVVAADRTERSESFMINPGLRTAIDFESGLQIVPGIAVPIGVGPSAGEEALFLYLSFEHPLRRAAR